MSFKGKKHTKNTKKKIGEKSIGRKSGMTNKKHTKGAKDEMSIHAKNRKIQPFSGKKHTIAVKNKIRQSRTGKLATDAQKINYKRAALKRWSDPIYAEKQLKTILNSLSYKKNKMESRFDIFLNKNLPKEYKYVGDGQFFLGGRCPDFLNIKGRKKIIELYGDYWHKNDDPQKRIKYFKKYGFDTLVLWEKELKDLKKLKVRIMKFNNG